MIKNGLDNPRLRAETFKARFLEAGVVEYEGRRVLIKPENLMKIAVKFKGAKTIVDHKDVNEKNAAKEIVGYMNNIWLGDDGWAWCDFTVNNTEAIDLINRGYSVSCCYLAVESGTGGTKNAVSYDSEIIDMEEDDKVTHLAIVENPRYEDAIILKNSIKKTMKNIFKFTKKSEAKENSVKEIDLESAAFEIGGSEVPVSDLIKAYKNAEDEKEKKEEKENEEEEKPKVNAEDEFEVDGKMVKVSEMARAYKSAKKNEEDEAKKNAEDEDKEKKEKENAEEEEKKEDEEKKKEAKKNSVDAEKITKDKAKYENSTERKSAPIITDSSKLALGRLAYGDPQKVTK